MSVIYDKNENDTMIFISETIRSCIRPVFQGNTLFFDEKVSQAVSEAVCRTLLIFDYLSVYRFSSITYADKIKL